MFKKYPKIKMISLVMTVLMLITGANLLVFSGALNLKSITGAQTSSPTGIANVTVTSTTYISLPIATIDFGPLDNNQNNNTLDDSPGPFELQNDGTVNVNVTIGATDLFSSSVNPNSTYQFACGTGEISCPTGSVTSFIDMPATASPLQIIADLPFANSGDQVEVDINVTVPGDEPAGGKTSTVTFVATET